MTLKKKVDEAKVEEVAKVEAHPLAGMYKKLDELQDGRDISMIPLNDPYWEFKKELNQAEFQRTL